jgi:hypothetical protein
MLEPKRGPRIYPMPRRELKTPAERSLTLSAYLGYLSLPCLIISGREGIRVADIPKPRISCPTITM